jgi:hypothetical protein
VFDLEVELSYPADGESLVVEQNPIVYLPEQVELVGTGSGRRTENEGERVTNKFFFRYSLKGVKPGETILPSVSVKYRLGESGPLDVLRTGQLTVRIKRVSLADRLLQWGSWAAGAILVFGAAVAAIRHGRKRTPQGEPEQTASLSEPPRDPFEKANRLRIEGDVREWIGEISRIVAASLAVRYRLGEPIRANRARKDLESVEPDEERRNGIADLLEECESLRYSPVVPPNQELDRIERKARDILNR